MLLSRSARSLVLLRNSLLFTFLLSSFNLSFGYLTLEESRIVSQGRAGYFSEFDSYLYYLEHNFNTYRAQVLLNHIQGEIDTLSKKESVIQSFPESFGNFVANLFLAGVTGTVSAFMLKYGVTELTDLNSSRCLLDKIIFFDAWELRAGLAVSSLTSGLMLGAFSLETFVVACNNIMRCGAGLNYREKVELANLIFMQNKLDLVLNHRY